MLGGKTKLIHLTKIDSLPRATWQKQRKACHATRGAPPRFCDFGMDLVTKSPPVADFSPLSREQLPQQTARHPEPARLSCVSLCVAVQDKRPVVETGHPQHRRKRGRRRSGPKPRPPHFAPVGGRYFVPSVQPHKHTAGLEARLLVQIAISKGIPSDIQFPTLRRILLSPINQPAPLTF